MNCNRFRRDLPDWLRGDLKEMDVAAMSAHSSTCRACGREEALERHLRGVWKSVPEAPPVPEMWPKVAAALETPSRSWQPIFRPARLAMASAFAFGALCAVLWSQNSGQVDSPVPPDGTVISVREEQHVIDVVRELRQLPDPDRERTAMEPPHLRHAAMMLGESDGR